MAPPSESYATILDTQVDADSAVTEDLMTTVAHNFTYLEEWLGKNYAAAVDHDHDGSNSKGVTLPGNSVGTAELKTDTDDKTTTSVGEILTFAAAAANGFFVRIKNDGSGQATKLFASAAENTTSSFLTNITLGTTGGSLGTARLKYVTSSGDVFWIWVLRDKVTKAPIIISTAPDHPAMSTGDPETMPHPFPCSYNEDIHEIVCITSPKKNGKYGQFIEDIHIEAKAKGKGVSEVVWEDYEIDEDSVPEWPTEDVTVGYDTDEDVIDLYHKGKKVKLKKVKIPQPSNVVHKKLRKKVTA